MLSLKDRSHWTPSQARKQFRQNFFPALPTGGIASQYAQVSVNIMPSLVAETFAEFCRMNSAPCPLVYRSKPGEVSAPTIAANCDIRTDQSMYGVFENGVCTRTVPDILNIPFDDLVCCYIGCSHSFELALSAAGLPVRHQETNISVPSYCTKIACHPCGPFVTNMVVSMRPMPRNFVQRASEVTSQLEPVHGAPVHIGHSCWLGIKDLAHPEYDDPPNIKEGDVLMYWGCGTTACLALTNAKLPLMVGLSPEANCCDFITDLENEVFCRLHPPHHGSLVPKVLFISEGLIFGSLLSDKALDTIEKMEKLVARKPSSEVTEECDHEMDEKVDSLAKAAMRLSHASSVAIVTHDNSFSNEGLSVLSIIKAVLATGNKEVILLATENNVENWNNAISRAMESGILKKSVKVIQQSHETQKEKATDILQVYCRMLSNIDGFKLDGAYPLQYTVLVGAGKQGGHWVTCAAELMTGSSKNHVTLIPDSSWSAHALAAAMYILNCCPIHSRYVRRGIGLYKPLECQQFVLNVEELNAVMSASRGDFSVKEEDTRGKINTIASSCARDISLAMNQLKF